MPRVTLGDRLETLVASPYLPKGKREFAESLLAYYRARKSLSAGRRLWVDRLETMVTEAMERGLDDVPRLVAEIDDVMTRLDSGTWDHGFLESLRDQAHHGGLSGRQMEVYERIKAANSIEAAAAKERWAGVYREHHIEDAKIVATYYASTSYFKDAAQLILDDEGYIPPVNLFNKMCKNKYAMKVIAAAKAEARYPIGSSVVRRANAKAWGLKSGGVVLSTNEPIVSATKGCKRYKVLPYGSATPVLCEERDIKQFKRKRANK
tara:strand:+ start:355 stop:1146 length:792 start_codon:yes stop_codon:yes gene_type:complete